MHLSTKKAITPTTNRVINVASEPNKKSLYLFLQFVDLNMFSKKAINFPIQTVG